MHTYANRVAIVLMSCIFLVMAFLFMVAGDVTFMAGDALPVARLMGGSFLLLAGFSLYPIFTTILSRYRMREALATVAAIALSVSLVFIEGTVTTVEASSPGSIGNCGTLLSGWLTTEAVQVRITRSGPFFRYFYRSLEDSCRMIRASGDLRTAATLAGATTGYWRAFLTPTEGTFRPEEREYHWIARSLEATAFTLEALRARPSFSELLGPFGLPKAREIDFFERMDRSIGRAFFHGLLSAARHQELAFKDLEKKTKIKFESQLDPIIDRDRTKIAHDLNLIDSLAQTVQTERD